MSAAIAVVKRLQAYRVVQWTLLFAVGLAAGGSAAAAQPPAASPSADGTIILPDEIDESGVAVGVEQPPDGAAVQAAPDVQKSVPVEVQSLFQLLSSSEIAVREAATSALVAMGPKMVEPLQQLQASSSDPEAIARAAMIVRRVQQTDLPHRIRTLMRQPDQIDQHRFYGWPPFAEVVGTNRAARQAFVELIDSYPRLVESSLEDEAEFAEVRDAVFHSISTSRDSRIELTTADAIAAQYLMIRDEKVAADHQTLTVQIVSTYPYSMRLNDPQHSKMLKELTNRWLLTVGVESVRPMLISLDFGLENGRELARRFLREPTDDRELYTHAMLLMARFGEPADLETVEGFLEDDREIFQINALVGDSVVATTQQYRDLALMASLRIRGMEVGDYFPGAQPHPTRVYLPQSIAFSEGEEGDAANSRVEAFRRYREATAASS